MARTPRSAHPGEEIMRRLATAAGKVPRQVREHVAGCSRCTREVDFLGDLAASLGSVATGPCPEPDLLVALGDGCLAEPEAHAVAAHAARCLSCAADLEALVRGGAPPRLKPSPARVVAAAAGTLLQRLRQLVQLEMPVHVALTARSTGARRSPRFGKAMVAYGDGRFAAARRDLLAARAAGEEGAHVDFYLGVCSLRAGRAAEAARDLARAVGASPSLAEYRWYLAQALLQDGRGEEAARELDRVARLVGRYRSRARSQARDVRAALRQG